MKTVILAVVVCVTLVVLQTVYFFIPPEALHTFDLLVRPAIYGALAAAVIVYTRYSRPVQSAFYANISIVISISLLAAAFLVITFFFGGGSNPMAPNIPVITRNLWVFGSVIILGEIVRYKIIKTANQNNIDTIVAAITIAIAFGQMNPVRIMITSGSFNTGIFFESVFRSLVISAVASYFAIKGNIISSILVSFVFSMLIWVMPIMPQMTALVNALLMSGFAFLAAILHRFFIDEGSRARRLREKREAKYAPKTTSFYVYNAATVVVIILVIAFFAGAFRIYPVVVLTNSMSSDRGFDRGAIVFVERIEPENVFLGVENGMVIHYLNIGRAEFLHRVVGYARDGDGNRVYITKGDANPYRDPEYVPQEDVLGIARASIPLLGHPYLLFRAVRNAF